MNKDKADFVFLSSLIGFLSYALVAVIIAVIIVIFGSNHPHGMDRLLYFLLPILFAPVGLVIGLVSSLILKEPKLKKIIVILSISFGIIIITLITGFLWNYLK
jgi:hypothetical protein